MPAPSCSCVSAVSRSVSCLRLGRQAEQVTKLQLLWEEA